MVVIMVVEAGPELESADHWSLDADILWMWEISRMGLSSWKASWM